MSEERSTIQGARNAHFYAAEILVALPHLSQVMAVFRDAGLQPAVSAKSEALDLGLLTLPDERSAADRLAEHVERKLAGRPHRPVPAAGEDNDTNRVLLALRSYFASEHGGWAPTLGKNRLIGGVEGGGIVSHGGGGSPEPASGPLPARGAGPGQGVRVGVLDTALAPHPWLAGGWVARYSDMLPTDIRYDQAAGHATFVAGLILSQAPGATVRMRQVLRKDNGFVADVWTVANEIVALGRSGVDVLNLSLVSYTEDGQPPLALATAIDRLDPNIVVVAAAGNHGDVDRRDPPVPGVDEHDTRKPTFPAALDDVTAVGAADNGGKVSPFTPRATDWIDFLAPGEGVLSTYLTGTVELDDRRRKEFTGLGRWSGTSFSAALISGAIAAGTEPGRVTARQALDNIRDSVAPPGAYPPGVPPFVWLDVR